MKHYNIWLSPPSLTGTEEGFLRQALASGWIAPAGPQLTAWEDTLSRHLGGYPTVALQSGTAALHLALKVLGLQKGQEVICPSLTFAGGVSPICYLGGKPVFVDCESSGYHLSYPYLKKALEHRGKKVHSVIVAHLFGRSADIAPIAELCKEYDVYLIEDAAEALGVHYQGQPAGTFGDMGFYSFNGNKIITASGGGALFAQDETLIRQATAYAHHCKSQEHPFEHFDVGYNYRFSNILSALGLAQWQNLHERIEKRRWNYFTYQKYLASHPKIQFLAEAEGSFSTYWLTTIEISDVPAKYQAVRQRLEAEKIESRPVWRPLHRQKPFDDCLFFGEGFGACVQRSEKGLCLPSGHDLTEEQIAFISRLVLQALD